MIPHRDSDTRRMAETENTGSVRSTGSAGLVEASPKGGHRLSARLINSTNPSKEIADRWAKFDRAEANIETQLADWREGWARDAMLIPAWNKMTVEEAIAFVRGEDPAPDLDAPLLNQIPGGML